MGKEHKKKQLKKRNAALQKENDLLKESVLRAEKAVETKSAYLSHMSHDIRTSLNGIIGMTGIAIKNFDEKEKVLDCLKKVDNSSQYLISLVNDILDMSRIESGRMSANHEPVDMRKIIDRCTLITEGRRCAAFEPDTDQYSGKCRKVHPGWGKNLFSGKRGFGRSRQGIVPF